MCRYFVKIPNADGARYENCVSGVKEFRCCLPYRSSFPQTRLTERDAVEMPFIVRARQAMF